MAEPEQKASGGAIKHYKDLLVYQQAYRAALMVSKLTRSFPRSEQFELARRESAAEFRRFLQMSIGSCEEIKVWLDFSRDEGYT